MVTDPALGVPEDDGALFPLDTPTLRLIPPAEPKPDAPVYSEIAPVSPVLPLRMLVDPVETVIVPVEPPFVPALGVVIEIVPLPPFEAPDDRTKAP